MQKEADGSHPFTIYYDGGCPVCSKEIRAYRKADGAEKLAWVDASDADKRALGSDLERSVAMAKMHVRDESGKLISGAAAFAAIWLRLPRTRWLGRILGTPLVLFFLEPVYRLFLKIRPIWRK